MSSVLNTVISLVRTPSMFIAIIAFLGLVLQKKSFSDIIKGTLKTFIGMVILTQGVNILSTSITPLSNGFTQLFAITDAKPLGDFNTFLGKWGGQVGVIMLLGFVLNILIARFTKFKTIFLTANILYWYPMLFIGVAVEHKLSTVSMFILAILIYICVITIMPYVMRKYVKELTGQDMFTIGHTTSIFCLLGIAIGTLFGKNEKNAEQSTEKLKLPVQTKEVIFEGQPFVTVAITNGMTFAAGMLILLQGVRMMLAEIVPAFRGIATKLAPGSVPAMDIPLIFPYGPNALLLGFLIAAAVNIISIFALGASGLISVALIPLMVACYFDVAPACIFANKRGGIKAVITTAIIGGFILTVLCAISIPMVSSTVGTFLQVYGGNEYSVWVIIADALAKLLSVIGL